MHGQGIRSYTSRAFRIESLTYTCNTAILYFYAIGSIVYGGLALYEWHYEFFLSTILKYVASTRRNFRKFEFTLQSSAPGTTDFGHTPATKQLP